MKEKGYVKEITNIDEDFAQWYTDIVRKAMYKTNFRNNNINNVFKMAKLMERFAICI